MRIVIAPDSFKGTLDAPAAAAAIAEGWRRVRPDDELVLLPLSDGGDGLAQALGAWVRQRALVDVTGPQGETRTAEVLSLSSGTAVVESAHACGLVWIPEGQRDPLSATTIGVGELLLAAKGTGARTICVGLGGSATVDGGVGAASLLGIEVRDDAGQSLTSPRAVDLERIAAASRVPGPSWDEIEVVLLSDVRTSLLEAAATFGPQKGATQAQVDRLARGLEHWADVVERDLTTRPSRHAWGTGAAGGLAFGLAVALDARIVDGARWVAEAVGLDASLDAADLLIVGEGQLDTTSFAGKVLGNAVARARHAGVASMAVVGRCIGATGPLERVEEASPDGPGRDPTADVARAAARLAEHAGSR